MNVFEKRAIGRLVVVVVVQGVVDVLEVAGLHAGQARHVLLAAVGGVGREEGDVVVVDHVLALGGAGLVGLGGAAEGAFVGS